MRFTIIGFFIIAFLAIWGGQRMKTPRLEQSLIKAPTQAVRPTDPTNQPSPTTQSSNPSATTQSPTSPPTSAPTQASLLDQVPKHNSQSDCWTIYQGGVYNITGFFGQHPGGDALLAQVCGRDMTIAFNAVPHSQRASQILEGYRIQ